ncbi:hypothetical protein N1851_018712 [Merluccius polli]|uniref:Uncharacterized protein n=1 Tax=Merluccius polli TaxID=89951 RepID=A0AA47NY43_MERPO|nr:hypothetical protein N1851_018712 [Merluccius polli]
MKHKNIIQKANRKKAEARKTGGGPSQPPLTEAEELAISQNRGRPVATSKGVVQSAPQENYFKKKEMVYLDRHIRKTDLEILLLERQLRWVHCHGETGEYVKCVNGWNYSVSPRNFSSSGAVT